MIKNTKIECALDARERPMHCHHEKTIVIDDRIAFVGGIDLTSESGDRYDTNDHPARSEVGWHDACARIEGPAVGDVAEHFRLRWHEVTGEALAPVPPPKPAGKLELQVVRTVPERIYDAKPKGDFTILESYMRALKGAERFIYIENQFLWSPEIEAVLHEKIVDPPHPDFRLVLLLPSKPNSGADDTRGVLGHLIEADDDAGRILACTLFARKGDVADPIYIHAKIAIVDDKWLTLGSANLNEHSLFNDTEMNIVSHDPGARTADATSPLGRASRAAGGSDPGRSGPGGRGALEADQQGPARTPRRGPAADPPARPPAARLTPLCPCPRPGFGHPRRRLTAFRPSVS